MSHFCSWPIVTSEPIRPRPLLAVNRTAGGKPLISTSPRPEGSKKPPEEPRAALRDRRRGRGARRKRRLRIQRAAFMQARRGGAPLGLRYHCARRRGSDQVWLLLMSPAAVAQARRASHHPYSSAEHSSAERQGRFMVRTSLRAKAVLRSIQALSLPKRLFNVSQAGRSCFLEVP